MEPRTKTLLEFLEKAEGSGKQFSSDELKAMLVSVSFDIDACKVILPKIMDQAILRSFVSSLRRDKGYEDILRILFPLLYLKLKNNDELLSIFDETNKSESVANAITNYLNFEGKKEPELLELMDKLKYCYNVCNKVIPLLELSKEEENQEKIWSIVEKSKFDWTTVRQLIQYLSSEDRVMEILRRCKFEESLFYNEDTTKFVLSLSKEENILEVLRNKENVDIATYYLAQIESEEKRMEITKEINKDYIWVALIPTLKEKSNIEFIKHKLDTLDQYNPLYPLYVIAFIPHCKTEEEILNRARKYWNFAFDKKELLFGILEHINQTDTLILLFNEISSKEVETEIIKKLNLKKKTNPELWDILAQTSYDKAMCEAIVPLLELAAKSDDDILKLLSEKKNPQNLCLPVMKYLKSQKNRVQVFHYHTDKEYIWEASGYLNDATLEAEFISYYYRKYFLARIHNRELVYDTIAKERYPEDLIVEANRVFKK